MAEERERAVVRLPAAREEGSVSLESALHARRSMRAYLRDSLSLSEVAQLLWSAQGTTDPRGGRRTAPSAGALYPLELCVALGAVESLAAGIYAYEPKLHELVRRGGGDVRPALSAAAWDQSFVGDGAIVMAISAVLERTTAKYGERGVRYVHVEAGHAAQNACLQAAALGLGAVVVGAFDDAAVARILGFDASEVPLLLLPVGRLPRAPRSQGPRA